MGHNVPSGKPAGYLPAMATPLADALFWAAFLAITISQIAILRSTVRAMRAGTDAVRTPREWAFAVGPAVALVVLMVFTWNAMHPRTIETQGTRHTIGVTS